MTDTAPHPVCFVDTETTGLDPDRHQIWEVGLILPDGSEHEWQLPVDLSRADPIALNIGRFFERVQEWGDEDEMLDEFAAEFMGRTRGLHLAGAVVSFDAERLWKLLRSRRQCPMWHYHLIDVEALAAGWIAAQSGPVPILIAGANVGLVSGRPPWRSEELSRAVGVDPDSFDRHTALGDARWAKAIYEAVMG